MRNECVHGSGDWPAEHKESAGWEGKHNKLSDLSRGPTYNNVLDSSTRDDVERVIVSECGRSSVLCSTPHGWCSVWSGVAEVMPAGPEYASKPKLSGRVSQLVVILNVLGGVASNMVHVWLRGSETLCQLSKR